MNYSRYFALEKKLKQNGHIAERQELIHTFTDGRKEGLKSLTETEYREFCRWIELKFNPNTNSKECDNMRKKIIMLFRKMEYTLPGGKSDMKAIYSWVIKYGYQKKPLNQYAYNELPKLVSQAEAVYKSYVKNL